MNRKAPRQLRELDRIVGSLAETTSLKDVKSIRDQAEAFRHHGHAASLGLKPQNRAVRSSCVLNAVPVNCSQKWLITEAAEIRTQKGNGKSQGIGHRSQPVGPLAARSRRAGRGIREIRNRSCRCRQRNHCPGFASLGTVILGTSRLHNRAVNSRRRQICCSVRAWRFEFLSKDR